MIQKVLTKYWLSLHLVVLFFATWVSVRYSNTGWAICLWLAFFAVQAFLLLPSVLRGETLGEARARSVGGAVHDPFLYAGVALICFTCIQWLNSGCSLVYLEDAEIWRYSAPPVSWLPYSIVPFPAFTVLSLMVVSVVGGVIFRNGAGKASKRFFLDAVSLVSGCIAIYMVIQSLSGVPPYSTWGGEAKACNWGTYFGFWMLVSLGGHLNLLDEGFGKTLVWSIFALLGNLLGMLQFETPIGIALFTVVAFVILGYWVFFLRREDGVIQLKLFSCVVMAVALAVVALTVLFQEHSVNGKIAMLGDPDYYKNLFLDRQFQAPLAWKVWQEHAWLGVGAGGFVHYGQALIGEMDWARWDACSGLLSNDWLQFLTEHGVVGVGLFVALIIILLVSLFSRLHVALRKQADGVELNPYVMSGALAAACVLLMSFLFSPLQSGAMLVSLLYVLAVIPGFIPTDDVNEVRG